jgi:hypothetical protein
MYTLVSVNQPWPEIFQTPNFDVEHFAVYPPAQAPPNHKPTMTAIKRKQDKLLSNDRKKAKVDSTLKPGKSASKHQQKRAQRKPDEPDDEWDDVVDSSEDEDYGGVSVGIEDGEEKAEEGETAMDLDKPTKDSSKGEKTEEEGMFGAQFSLYITPRC